MIKYITGLPRSGKSYRAVHMIKNEYMNPKHKDFKKHRYLYTNIGGLKFDDITLDLETNPIDKEGETYTKKIVKMDWDRLYRHISKVYNMAEADQSDDDLVAYLEKHKLSPGLFIIDECYKYFKKMSDPILVWWLAYHGHLGHDIILMLQNKSLIHWDYKAFSEEYIDAQPKSQALTNNQFRYYHYGSEQYIPEQRFETSKIIAKQEIFDLYKSGDLHKPKKILHKYYIGMALIVVIVLFIFYRLTTKQLASAPDQDSATQDQITRTHVPDRIAQSNLTYLDTELYLIRCDSSECSMIDEEFQHFNYPAEYFKSVVIRKKFTFLYSKVVNEVYRVISDSRSRSKQNMYALKDYYYEINPKTVQHYFPDWFKQTKIESKSLFDNENSSDLLKLNDTSEGAPAEA